MTSPFDESDPRLEFSIEGPVDPRIHFAINCGARSCPAIQVYGEKNLEAALDGAASTFLQENVEIIGNEVKLSKLLSWYGSDFGADQTEILK